MQYWEYWECQNIAPPRTHTHTHWYPLQAATKMSTRRKSALDSSSQFKHYFKRLVTQFDVIRCQQYISFSLKLFLLSCCCCCCFWGSGASIGFLPTLTLDTELHPTCHTTAALFGKMDFLFQSLLRRYRNVASRFLWWKVFNSWHKAFIVGPQTSLPARVAVVRNSFLQTNGTNQRQLQTSSLMHTIAWKMVKYQC